MPLHCSTIEESVEILEAPSETAALTSGMDPMRWNVVIEEKFVCAWTKASFRKAKILSSENPCKKTEKGTCCLINWKIPRQEGNQIKILHFTVLGVARNDWSAIVRDSLGEKPEASVRPRRNFTISDTKAKCAFLHPGYPRLRHITQAGKASAKLLTGLSWSRHFQQQIYSLFFLVRQAYIMLEVWGFLYASREVCEKWVDRFLFPSSFRR